MSRNDPTDDVLAAIASIFDKPDAPLAPPASETALEVVPPVVTRVSDYQGYSRSGPGPLDAIRFKWTARRDENGKYFVDETIGDQSRGISSGPMPESEIVAFVDARVQEARERFEKLKNDMTVHATDPQAARVAVERAHIEHDTSEDQGF